MKRVCLILGFVTGIVLSSRSTRAQAIPNAPSNLVDTAVSPFQINVSWTDNSSNEDGFKIERSTDGSSFIQIAQVLPNTTVYRNTGLWPGTTYDYRVRAYNVSGNSDFSNVADASTPILCPLVAVGWGDNSYGERNPPSGLSNVVAIAAGQSHNLAIKSNGTVVCWGNNYSGQGTPPSSLSNAVAIAGGSMHSLALKSDGTVVGWGSDYYGQKIPPAGLTGVVAITAGAYHSLALKSNGSVIGWGYNYDGETNVPVGLTGVVAIAGGRSHGLALKSNGTVVGWGYNSQGQTNVPAGLTGVVAIAAGGAHSLALKGDGTIVGWGSNQSGQTTTPPGLSNVVAIAAGGDHSLALRSDGTVVGWGRTNENQTTPPTGVVPLVAIAAGSLHSLAMTCMIGAPSALSASAGVTNQIDLSWTDNSNNEDGFRIERALDNGGSPGTWVQVATVGANVTTYSDSGELLAGMTYWYRMRAFNTGGNSDYSNLASATTTALPPAAEGPYTTSFQTNTISGVTSNWMGAYIIGSNTFADVLLIQNSGALSDSAGFLGYEESSGNNGALITGPSSVWSNGYTLVIGYSGTDNTLAVSNGGCVYNGYDGYLGYNSGSSNNHALVTGPGSVWSSSANLYVGLCGAGNSLVINDGGRVADNRGYLGVYPSSSNNTVSVNGVGSVWSNSSDLYVGRDGARNSLVISEGGQVLNNYCYLGFTSTSNNVLVTDAGSVLNARDAFAVYVGTDGSGNSLVVSNGGAVYSGGGCIGSSTTASGNSVLVTGLGSIWSNGGWLAVGYSGTSNSLAVSHGGRVVNTYCYVGFYGSDNRVLVTDPGSVWNNDSSLVVGLLGGGSSLVISNGGQVVCNDGTLGYYTSGNTVVLTGPGSVWSSSNSVYIGDDGRNNSLVINNGGLLASSSGCVGCSYSSNNTVLVTDPGSVWSNSSDLYVGWYAAPYNSLVISNGGQVLSGTGHIGHIPGSATNRVLVTGSGSIWNNPGVLYVGSSGTSNSLVIRDGGQVVSGSGILGDGSKRQSALVTGPGAVWSNTSSLYIGHSYGEENALVISNGGQVVSGYSYVGYDSRSSNNSVRVANNGTWQNNHLWVGYQSRDNLLTVAGGAVVASNLFVGCFSSASNNTVTVDSGSLIVTNALRNGSLVLGQDGQGKLVLNGGTVTVDRLVLASGARSQIAFNGGSLRSADTVVTKNSVFAVGDGTHAATFYLEGGTHGFADGLQIRTNASLVGCGLINGRMLVEGTLRIDCGGLTIVTGTVTNYGRIEVGNGALLVFYDRLVNYGQIVATNGTVRYLSTLDNYGTLLGNVQSGITAWISPSDGRWEDAENWSAGMPTNGYQCLIANAASKTVTIDAATYSGHSNSLTVFSLTLAAPSDSTNVLRITDVPLTTPLQISDGLAVGTNCQLAVSNGAVAVSQLAGGSCTIDGEVSLQAATLVATNGPMSIGQSGAAVVTVSNSVVLMRETFLGQSTNASSLVTVVGSNSVWSSSSAIYIGYPGCRNNQVIVDGGQLFGAGVTVGSGGWGNTMMISNGAKVWAYGYIGTDPGGSNNTVLVTGVGSVWSGNFVTVGGGGSSNTLVIDEGGQVTSSGTGIIGDGSRNNAVLISGSGSVWSSGSLTVGNSGAAHSLVVSNEGQLICSGQGRVGYNSRSNRVLVAGIGSIWSNQSSLVIGGGSTSSDGNSVVVSNGGYVTSSSFSIGSYRSQTNNVMIKDGGRMFTGSSCDMGNQSSRNTLLVTDPGSTWSNTGTLTIGNYYSSMNNLVISNGGQVFGGSCLLGNTYASNNTILVTGTGSLWSNCGDVNVGYYAAGNRLSIRDGGQVIDCNGVIAASGHISNMVLVADAGSSWVNTGTLSIGYSQRGSSLVISNGGKAVSQYGQLNAYQWRSNEWVCIVTGTGSVWSNENSLIVGQTRGPNCVFLSRDGQLVSDAVYLGFESRSNSNRVHVMDGAAWKNRLLHVGEAGSTNAVVVSGGEVSATAELIIGAASSDCQNVVQLDSGTIAVTNASADAVFEVRNGRFILNGGTVRVDRFVMTNFCARLIRSGGTLIYGTAVLDPMRDDDGDGMPNGWEQSHGLDPLNPADANADPDGDGFTNLQEYQAGTDPTNSASVFRITELWPEDDDMFLTWTAVGGKRYALQTTTNGSGGFFTNNFIDLNPAIVATGTGETEVSVLHLGGATNGPARFYRVRLVP